MHLKALKASNCGGSHARNITFSLVDLLTVLKYRSLSLLWDTFGYKGEVLYNRMVRRWHRLPIEVVDVPSLEISIFC